MLAEAYSTVFDPSYLISIIIIIIKGCLEKKLRGLETPNFASFEIKIWRVSLNEQVDSITMEMEWTAERKLVCELMLQASQ